MDLVFATNNSHKLEEAQKALGKGYKLIKPVDLGFEGDIPETHTTIRENSIEKAQFIWDHFKTNCFADDTGLEVDYLGGAPGVYSARYAGEGKDQSANRKKLLKELEGVPYEKRTARFKCIVSLIIDGELSVFEGVCEGHIAFSESEGVQGFGYDKVFIPNDITSNKTMAEVPMEVKNLISHRGKVLRLLACHLSQNHRQ